MKKLLAIALLVLSSTGFAAWPSGQKEGFKGLLIKQCRSDLPMFSAKQCVSWSQCSVDLLEEGYPLIRAFMKEIRTQQARFLGQAYFVGRLCGAREIKKLGRQPASLDVVEESTKTVEEANKRNILRILRKDLRILKVQYKQATGIHKKDLKTEIDKLQYEMDVLEGKREECK